MKFLCPRVQVGGGIETFVITTLPFLVGAHHKSTVHFRPKATSELLRKFGFCKGHHANILLVIFGKIMVDKLGCITNTSDCLERI